jgi:hypothetical protein
MPLCALLVGVLKLATQVETNWSGMEGLDLVTGVPDLVRAQKLPRIRSKERCIILRRKQGREKRKGQDIVGISKAFEVKKWGVPNWPPNRYFNAVRGIVKIFEKKEWGVPKQLSREKSGRHIKSFREEKVGDRSSFVYKYPINFPLFIMEPPRYHWPRTYPIYYPPQLLSVEKEKSSTVS